MRRKEGESLSYARRWSIVDGDGVRHLPLRANDEEAAWTPIACGWGLAFPGPQSRDDPVTCPACIEARRQHS